MFYLILGTVFVVLGILSLTAYLTGNEKMFWKKKYMIRYWGKTLGTIIHFTGYVIIPILIGTVLIITELM